MISVLNAGMEHSKEDGYIGRVEFTVENHKQPYEITLYSKNGNNWSYSLNFLNESGGEEEIDQVEEILEEDDEQYEKIISAAKSQLRT
ncbi:hypothetical protein [Paenibacillus xerothermodurans]|uniref:Uncharacterized protein n=1 Tax=Paenibacillus xerothermodurans TaxID=1977292 RepID=A0A2W1NBF1_PAEXE|nr:hypothetical protein [Paenibacillus xerothermodurans]PZE21747.1 hypothetical protein CBW46_004855 [Paenibacillus xerothermodurans]